MQCAKKVMSYSQGLVEFPVGLADSLGNLSEEQVKFLRKMFLRNFKVSSPISHWKHFHFVLSIWEICKCTNHQSFCICVWVKFVEGNIMIIYCNAIIFEKLRFCSGCIVQRSDPQFIDFPTHNCKNLAISHKDTFIYGISSFFITTL